MLERRWTPVPRETLRQYLRQEVEVLATYGRKRRFTVGVSLNNELIEISPENPDGILAECEYAAIKVMI